MVSGRMRPIVVSIEEEVAPVRGRPCAAGRAQLGLHPVVDAVGVGHGSGLAAADEKSQSVAPWAPRPEAITSRRTIPGPTEGS